MTLPASDAFSLSHDTTRPPYSLSLRPTSPKIPFVSSHSRPISQPYNVPPRKTVRSRRTLTKDTTNGYADDHPKREAPVPCDTQRNRNVPTAAAASAAGVQSPSPPLVEWEIPRKILHSSIGFLTLYLYLVHGSPRAVVSALGAALAIIVPADVLRLNFPGFERIYEKALGFLMRESEKRKTNGVIWYIVGVMWVLLVYPLDVAVVSILILSWADTAASTVGRAYGRKTPPLPRRLLCLPLAPRKSLAGFIAGSVTGAAIIAGFWSVIAPLGEGEPVWTFETGVMNTGAFCGWAGLTAVSIMGGLVSGISEALDLGLLDDNLTLPILSGGCIWGFFRCLKWFL